MRNPLLTKPPADRRRNPIDLERVPGVIVKEIPDALARAVRVGAAPDADYVGAGMTSIVFLSRGRAWKVARPGPADLRAEAEYLAAANKLRLPEGRAAKVYAYHEGQRVIEREYVEGRYAPDERAWDLRQALAKRLSKDWGPPEFKKDSYVLTPEDEIVLVDAGTSRRGENLAAYILKVMDGTYKDTPDRSWAWELRQDVSDGRLSRERAEEVFSEMARHWDLKSVVAEQRALFKENPHHPDVLEILERKFPLDWGFWGFDVKKHIEKDAFGYLAPIGVEVKALPGEEVVTIRHHRKDPTAARYGEGSDEDFTGAKAIFTPEPIPAAQVIKFGLYPDYYALPHFLIEILNGADHVELQNARGDLALIHRDTYPSEMREHRGKVADYRVTYFDEHGPSGHHNGDFYGLILEALGGGYRRLAPGALDRLGL